MHKINVPKPILITDEESKGVDAVEGTLPREEGDRLAASYINYYTANGGVVFRYLGIQMMNLLAKNYNNFIQTVKWLV